MAYSYAIEQAIRAAAVLHKEQIRKGAVPYPYITHVFAVAMLVSDYTDDEDTIVAALLHDTIEDTGYRERELAEDFGQRVKDIVLSISEPHLDPKSTTAWMDKKKQYIKQLRSATERALLVVAADKIHNMRSIVEEYYDNHRAFLTDFGDSIDTRVLYYQEISNILNSKLKNKILTEFNNVFREYRNFLERVVKAKK